MSDVKGIDAAAGTTGSLTNGAAQATQPPPQPVPSDPPPAPEPPASAPAVEAPPAPAPDPPAAEVPTPDPPAPAIPAAAPSAPDPPVHETPAPPAPDLPVHEAPAVAPDPPAVEAPSAPEPDLPVVDSVPAVDVPVPPAPQLAVPESEVDSTITMSQVPDLVPAPDPVGSLTLDAATTPAAVPDTVGGVVHAGAPADPAPDDVTAIMAPLTRSVAVEPIGYGEAAGSLTTSAGEGIASATPVDLGIDPFSVTVAPLGFGAAPPAVPGQDAAVPPADGGAPADPSPQHALTDGAATTAAPAAAGATTPDAVHVLGGSAASPAADAGGGLGGAFGGGLEAPGGLDTATLGGAGGLEAPTAAGSVAGPPAGVDPLGIAVPGSGSGAAVPPPDAHADSFLGVVAQAGQDTRIVASAALLTLAGAVVLGPRVGGAGADTRLVFTNVRLLPCLLKDAAGRQLSALSEAVAPAVAVATGTPAAGGTRGTPAMDAAAVMGEDAESRLRRVLGELSEGFGRGAGGAAGEAADSLSDSRLVVQIGMLLGFVYMAFLSVWFWATRARWGTRA